MVVKVLGAGLCRPVQCLQDPVQVVPGLAALATHRFPLLPVNPVRQLRRVQGLRRFPAFLPGPQGQDDYAAFAPPSRLRRRCRGAGGDKSSSIVLQRYFSLRRRRTPRSGVVSSSPAPSHRWTVLVATPNSFAISLWLIPAACLWAFNAGIPMCSPPFCTKYRQELAYVKG